VGESSNLGDTRRFNSTGASHQKKSEGEKREESKGETSGFPKKQGLGGDSTQKSSPSPTRAFEKREAMKKGVIIHSSSKKLDAGMYGSRRVSKEGEAQTTHLKGGNQTIPPKLPENPRRVVKGSKK